ncbi:MAG: hypothetical protein VW405_21785 [Rhodospirillaceae bacterium]
MTAVAWKDFAAQCKRLEGLRFAPKSLQTHWEALQDIPLSALEAGITRSQRTRDDFPSPAQLREDIDAATRTDTAFVAGADARVRPLEAPVELGALPTGTVIRAMSDFIYVCDTCRDTGWDEVRAHGAHGHATVRKCACWSTNPVLIAKRKQQAQYAAQRVQRGAARG